VAFRRDDRFWQNLAYSALETFIADQEGAVVWPEVEAHLAEPGWLHRNLDESYPETWNLNPHHLTYARRALEAEGKLERHTRRLNDRPVAAFVDPGAPDERAKTATDRLAGKKRRLYRTYLGWTSDPTLCGQVAEHVRA
jgi:hypothetical protein